MPRLDLVVAGGTAVTPWGVAQVDIGIADGVIQDLAQPSSGFEARDRVDVEGFLVLPGGVDPHVHFENPSMGTTTAHTFREGTEAAALGGTTTVIDFAFQVPGETPLETIRHRRSIADPQVVIDYGLHGCITHANERALDEVDQMVASGYPSSKIFMVYKEEGWIVEDGPLVHLMRRMAAAGGTVLVHAENEALLQWGIAERVAEGDLGPGGHARSRPPIVEVEAIRRAIHFSGETGCPLFIVHMSTGGGVDAVREAQDKSIPVTAETCAHYLVLDEGVLDGPDGFRYVMSPPLRSQADQDRLWEGLAEGIIAGLGSDDAAYLEEYKLRGKDDFRKIANGIPGVQARIPVIFSEGVVKGRIGLERFVDAVATQPARIFGLYPKKGILAPGSDADILVLDPETTWFPTPNEMHTSIEYTCYEELEVTGRPVHVWSRGRQVVRHGRLVADPGRGRFIRRSASSSPSEA